jgi:hypothetical protein
LTSASDSRCPTTLLEITFFFFGRVITKGIVKEKLEARANYEQAVAQGNSAQLLEQKRADVFELVCKLLTFELKF